MLELGAGAKLVALAVPFMIASTGRPQEINKTRLIESAIQAVFVGVFVAAAGYFIAFPVLQEQVAQMRREGLETRALVREMKQEIQAQIEFKAGKRDLLDGAQDARIRQLELDLARRH